MTRGGLIPSRRRATTIVELAKMMMINLMIERIEQKKRNINNRIRRLIYNGITSIGHQFQRTD